MNSYGIQGKLIKWFENYLFKRRQKVIESLGSNYIVLIVDGQWNVLAKTPIGIYI
jgi:hypothetical protein